LLNIRSQINIPVQGLPEYHIPWQHANRPCPMLYDKKCSISKRMNHNGNHRILFNLIRNGKDKSSDNPGDRHF
ncbi:MAG: hypothetical protein RBR01_04220, partial [Desulfobacterales bacterium]|nr:hypothetical protein [Desulfobacterales bacterium]